MQTPYWKEQETQPTYTEYTAFYGGCATCACDHGCNQWLQEQNVRAALLFKILAAKGNTDLDRVVQMDLKRIGKIWWWMAFRPAKRI
jgi:hypothetical protein